MFRRQATFFMMAAVFVLTHVADSSADVVFNLSPGAGGTTILEIIGTGQVGNDGFNAFSSSGEFLLVDPNVNSGNKFTDSTSLGITLDGQTADSISFLSLDGPVDFTLFDLTFDGLIGFGAELSELNGVYQIDDPNFNFNGFLAGMYILNNDFGTDVGSITVNVSTIPEPTNVSFIGLVFLTQTIRRRRRK